MRIKGITLIVSALVVGAVSAGPWEKHGLSYEAKSAAEKH